MFLSIVLWTSVKVLKIKIEPLNKKLLCNLFLIFNQPRPLRLFSNFWDQYVHWLSFFHLKYFMYSKHFMYSFSFEMIHYHLKYFVYSLTHSLFEIFHVFETFHVFILIWNIWYIHWHIPIWNISCMYKVFHVCVKYLKWGMFHWIRQIFQWMCEISQWIYKICQIKDVSINTWTISINILNT